MNKTLLAKESIEFVNKIMSWGGDMLSKCDYELEWALEMERKYPEHREEYRKHRKEIAERRKEIVKIQTVTVEMEKKAQQEREEVKNAEKQLSNKKENASETNEEAPRIDDRVVDNTLPAEEDVDCPW